MKKKPKKLKYDKYVPKELDAEAQRPGCLDYQKCPSLINGQIVPYFAKKAA
jgi:hypothetical protein